MRNQAAPSPKQAEARHLPQQIVEGQRRRARNIFCRQHRRLRRQVAKLFGCAGLGNHHGFVHRKNLEANLQRFRRRAFAQCHFPRDRLKPGRLRTQCVLPRRQIRKRKFSV